MTAARKRVLFVDDDASILTGLGNLFYKESRRWDMVFALGGAPAITELERAPFDVVVSDMRMPGMDGDALLTLVKERFPATVRILLSGHCERQALVRAMPVIHQMFSKPCNAKSLRDVIDGSTALEMVPYDAGLWDVIGRCDCIPSRPAIYFEFERLLDSPVATIADVTSLVIQDPGISAKLLQLVNSAYFGVSRGSASIEDAVRLIGLDQIKYIALTAPVFGTLAREPIAGLSLEEVGAFETATFAARLVDPRLRADTFAAALLRDLGQTVLAVGMTATYQAIADRVRATHESVSAVEREVLRATHADIGAAMLATWGIPSTVCEAIRFHHDPGSAPAHVREIASAVHVADCMLGTPYLGARLSRAGIDAESLGRAGMLDKLDAWCALAG